MSIQKDATGFKLPAGIRINNMSPGSRIYTHQYGSDGRVKQSTWHRGNQNVDVTGQPFHKTVDNKFNITNCQMGNVIHGGSGPITLDNKQEIFEKGSRKTDIGIKGGKFQNVAIGGDGEFNNQRAKFEGGSLRSDVVRKMWEEDISSSLLLILKHGVTTEQIVQLIRKGFNLATIHKVVQGKDEKAIQLLINSMLDYQEK